EPVRRPAFPVHVRRVAAPVRGRRAALHRTMDRRTPQLEAGALALRVTRQAKRLMDDIARGKRAAVLRQLASPPCVLGILNVTPDSFSAGGRFGSAEPAVAHARAMAAAGCDVVDVGGESTRPGAVPVSTTDERARIEPVLARLASAEVPISIDTYK